MTDATPDTDTPQIENASDTLKLEWVSHESVDHNDTIFDDVGYALFQETFGSLYLSIPEEVFANGR